MAALEARGMLQDTVVAFLSDHGELLGHFGMLIKSIDEYPMLYDVGLHVPLIVRKPGGEAGRVVADPVELVDLAPTLLSCAGLEVPPEMQGTSQRGCALRRRAGAARVCVRGDGSGEDGARRPLQARALSGSAVRGALRSAA